MTPQTEEKPLKKQINQINYLFIILWLLPIILLNIGWKYSDFINYRWEEEERTLNANQEVERLSIKSDISYCFTSVVNSFKNSLKSNTEIFGNSSQENQLSNYIKNNSESIFKTPFPKYDIFVFRLNKDFSKSKIIYSNLEDSSIYGSLNNTFEMFVKIESENLENNEENNKIALETTKTIFGQSNNSFIIAKAQRSKATNVFYKSKSSWLIWDYFSDENTGDIFGYFIFFENNIDAFNSAKLITISEFSSSQKDSKNPKYAAFIPLFPEYGGVTISKELSTNKEILSILESWIPKSIKELTDWQRNGLPSKLENTNIGKYQTFFHIGPNQSHASVLFVPILENNLMPIWLIIVDIIALLTVAFLLLRGFLFGKWPKISVKSRFVTAYFLAACLPLGLLIIASYGYISDYWHISEQESQSKLKLSINQFDNMKTQLQDEYHKAFAEIQNNTSILKALEKLNKIDKESNGISPVAMEAITGILSVLNKQDRDIPILSFSIIDEYGNCLSNIGNSLCPYYRTYDNKEYLPQNTISNKDINKNIFNLESSLNFNIILNSLREQINHLGSDKKRWNDQNSPVFYTDRQTLNYNQTEDYISKGFNNIILKKSENETYCNIYNFIKINEVPRFAIILYWKENELDEKSFKTCITKFGINEPNLIFAAYKVNAQGIRTWPEKFDRHSHEIKNESIEILKQAYIRQNFVSYHDKRISIIAQPSKKYRDVFFIGAVFSHNLEIDIFYRFWICVIIIIIALIMLYVCIHYSTVLFLKPIIKLKTVLDKISEGNYDIELKSNGKDEFGLMCHQFNKMTQELSERDKLASLLSDYAIESIGKKESNEAKTNIEPFKGVFLVSDIRNFTTMCEKYESYQITELLNNHFAQLTKIIVSNGGRIYKYIGDAVEVVFADNDDAEKSSVERALKTGFEVLKCVKSINEDRKNKNLFEYSIGIGLSYGEMASGTIGSLNTRLDYAIIGEIINQAPILERASVCNPDFPMVVNKEFVDSINSIYPEINFLKIDSENEIDGYKISNDSISELENKIIKEKDKDKSETISDNDKEDIDNNKTKIIYEVEEYYSFKRKFIPGIIFIGLLTIIMASGIYFVYTTANNNEKNNLSVINSRRMDQILCDKTNKTAFDIVSRTIASSIQEQIEKYSNNDINLENISNNLKQSIESNKNLSRIDIKSVFIKVDGIADINTNDKTFIDKLKLSPIINIGYTDNDLTNICNSFRIVTALNSLDDISNKLYLSEKDSELFKATSQKYMTEKYLNTSTGVFGENISIDTFVNAKNASMETVYSNKYHYIFWLDYYDNNKKLIGYLLVSMPTNEVRKSIPLLLNAYSKDGTLISIKNKNTGKWSFSENVPDDIRNGVLNSDSKITKSKEEDIKYLGNEYLYNILAVTNKANIDIDETSYEIYLTRLCSLNLGNPRNALFWVFFTIFAMSVVLWKISKGTSIINRSIKAKLWVTLLIVAVIPVISVFFVFGLFRSEYYFLKKQKTSSEMLHYSELFEQKSNFSNPLIWNFIKTKNKSNELLNIIRSVNINSNQEQLKTEKLKDLRFLLNNWLIERKPWEEYKTSLVNFKIDDIFIYGMNDWDFSFNDLNAENKDLERNIYEFFKIIVKNNLTKANNNDVFNIENFNDTNLKYIQNTLGNDIYYKIINGINTPIYFNYNNSKIGIMFSAISGSDKPEGIIVWIINYNNYDYLKNLSKVVNSDYSIYFTEKNKYGYIYPENDNRWKIPLGECSAFISSSDLPISTNLKIKNQWYLIEARPSYQNPKALLLLSLPEINVFKEIIYLSIAFYLLLGFSLLIIIHMTKKISEDIINPINSMVTAIQEINKENFLYRINSDRDDELGDLCNSFDRMVKGIEEKLMMSHMLSNTAKKYTLKEGSISQRTKSVMVYIGIPDFSSLNFSDNYSDIFDKLKEQTDIVSKIIIEEGGEIDKTIADKILAVFPIEQDENMIAKSACMAAKRLIELENSNKLPLPISIGINYGEVIIGFIGVGNKRDFTVIGDAVNISSRIESLAEKLKTDRCLISEAFYHFIEKAFKAEIYGKVELKGKSEPMKVYRLS